MKKVALIVLVFCGLLISGCTGAVYNTKKNCEYHYLLHPAVSVSKIIGGCGPVDQLP